MNAPLALTDERSDFFSPPVATNVSSSLIAVTAARVGDAQKIFFMFECYISLFRYACTYFVHTTEYKRSLLGIVRRYCILKVQYLSGFSSTQSIHTKLNKIRGIILLCFVQICFGLAFLFISSGQSLFLRHCTVSENKNASNGTANPAACRGGSGRVRAGVWPQTKRVGILLGRGDERGELSQLLLPP